MNGYDVDLFVIGGGSGGVRAARIAASHGARVAVAEASRFGGTCVIRGCIPKKLLVYAAEYRDDFEDAVAFGWRSKLPEFDWGQLIANKNKEIARLEGIYRNLLANAGAETIAGRAELIDAHTVRVGGEVWRADKILIATGGHPWVPVIPGCEGIITSDEALELKELPRRITIVGGGYIGVEFAGVFANLGSEVRVIIRGEELLNGFDDDLRVGLARAMRDTGVEIHTRTTIARIERSEAGFTFWTDKGQELDTDALMFATGRIPNTAGLGLEAVGVALDADGAVVVDEWSRTSVPNIYAVGDVTDRLNLTPVAIREGHAFADTVFGGRPTKASHENVPTAVFSHPPIGTVGLTETEARARHGRVDIYKSRFRPLKHTLTGRQVFTLMKLVVDPATDRVLGCHMLGEDAPEIIQGMAVALQCGATKRQFDATVGIHPTAAEEFVTMRTKEPEAQAKAAE